MTDIFMKGGEEKMYDCSDGQCYSGGCSSASSCAPRSFLTKEEKIEILNEYKERLDKEAKGVAERIAELEKN